MKIPYWMLRKWTGIDTCENYSGIIRPDTSLILVMSIIMKLGIPTIEQMERSSLKRP